MTSIAIIIPYFGKWPVWHELFYASCRHNSSIDFHLFTDLPIPSIAEESNNIFFHHISFSDYCSMSSDRLNIDFHPYNPYKLCDLRPFYGYIHQDILKDYGFWGYGDIDLVWGDIRHFYNDEILQRYDVLSTHADRLSGHLTLVRNTKRYLELPFMFPKWKELLSSPNNHAVDEITFTRKLYPMAQLMWKVHHHVFFRFRFQDEWKSYNKFCNCFNLMFKPTRIYLKEQYTTPWFTEADACNPDIIKQWLWIYSNGHIIDQHTNNEMIYLHFLSLKKIWKDSFYNVNREATTVQIDLNGIQSY